MLLPSAIFATEWPNWARDLNPTARFQLKWLERYESTRDESIPELLVQWGVEPQVLKNLKLGFELSTGEATMGGLPDAVNLSNGSTSKSILIRKAFLKIEFLDPIRIEIKGGKFSNPISTSPMIWDDRITPEGFFEKIESRLGTQTFLFSLHANQWSLDQAQASTVNGTPQRRSWLLIHGLSAETSWGEFNRAKLSLEHYGFYDISESIASTSNTFGNTSLSASRLRYRYAPAEVIGELSGSPLGIASQAMGAIAINFRTPDRQRGFWVEGHLGNAWARNRYRASLSYIYNEPDLTVAAFSSRDYGRSNRKGFLTRLSYYATEQCRIGGSFLFVETLASSATQSTRKEIQIETELKF